MTVVFLKKTSYSYKFRNITPEDISKKVCSDFGIEIGILAVTGVKITRNYLGIDLYSIIIGSYYQASIINGKNT